MVCLDRNEELKMKASKSWLQHSPRVVQVVPVWCCTVSKLLWCALAGCHWVGFQGDQSRSLYPACESTAFASSGEHLKTTLWLKCCVFFFFKFCPETSTVSLDYNFLLLYVLLNKIIAQNQESQSLYDSLHPPPNQMNTGREYRWFTKSSTSGEQMHDHARGSCTVNSSPW